MDGDVKGKGEGGAGGCGTWRVRKRNAVLWLSRGAPGLQTGGRCGIPRALSHRMGGPRRTECWTHRGEAASRGSWAAAAVARQMGGDGHQPSGGSDGPGGRWAGWWAGEGLEKKPVSMPRRRWERRGGCRVGLSSMTARAVRHEEGRQGSAAAGGRAGARQLRRCLMPCA